MPQIAKCDHGQQSMMMQSQPGSAFVMVQAKFVLDGDLISHGQHLPGQAVWLVCEARSSGERKYYFTNHPPDTLCRTLLRAIKARWACEQAHQQLKDELGLVDHYEGRSWLGLHHHALLTMMAFTYLQHRRLLSASQAGGKSAANAPGPPPQPSLSTVRRALLAAPGPMICVRCPHCSATINLRQLE
jgi:hypothetical protein